MINITRVDQLITQEVTRRRRAAPSHNWLVPFLLFASCFLCQKAFKSCLFIGSSIGSSIGSRRTWTQDSRFTPSQVSRQNLSHCDRQSNKRGSHFSLRRKSVAFELPWQSGNPCKCFFSLDTLLDRRRKSARKKSLSLECTLQEKAQDNFDCTSLLCCFFRVCVIASSPTSSCSRWLRYILCLLLRQRRDRQTRQSKKCWGETRILDTHDTKLSYSEEDSRRHIHSVCLFLCVSLQCLLHKTYYCRFLILAIFQFRRNSLFFKKVLVSCFVSPLILLRVRRTLVKLACTADFLRYQSLFVLRMLKYCILFE